MQFKQQKEKKPDLGWEKSILKAIHWMASSVIYCQKKNANHGTGIFNPLNCKEKKILLQHSHCISPIQKISSKGLWSEVKNSISY